MSLTDKLLKNERLVHIVSEAVVILGVTFYFSSKNKQLQNHIDQLAQRLEEQEERFAKLENTLTELTKGQKQLGDSSGEMKQFFSTALYNSHEQIRNLNLRIQELEELGIPTEKPNEDTEQQPMRKPVQKPAEQPVRKPVQKPSEQPVRKPVQKPSEQPARELAQKPAEQPAQKPAEQLPQKPQKPLSQPTVRIAEQILPPPIEIVFVPPPNAKKAEIEEISESDTESDQEDLSDSELDEEIQEELRDLKKQEVSVKNE